MSFFKRLKERVSRTTESVTRTFVSGLSKTSDSLVGTMDDLFRRSKIDEEMYEELEEILIGADVGVTTTMELTDRLRREVKERTIKDPQALKPLLSEMLSDPRGGDEGDLKMNLPRDGLSVFLI